MVRVSISIVRLGDIDPDVFQRETVIAQWEESQTREGHWHDTRRTENYESDAELLARLEVALRRARNVILPGG